MDNKRQKQTSSGMNNRKKAIVNFMYFGNNYPRDFIEQVWADNPHMILHFREKFNNIYSIHGTITFFKWFMELSDNYKVELIEWIEENYLAFQHLTIEN